MEMTDEQEKALEILVTVAKALLDEVGSGGDLGYHLDVPEFAGKLREALGLLGEPYPKPSRLWRMSHDDN